MNYRFTGYLLGVVSLCEGVLMIAPLILSAVKGEDWVSFAYAIAVAIAVGLPLALFSKPKKKTMRVTGGLVSCSLCWILISVVGCLPFVFSNNANFLDALFETVSGFTTTGATIFDEPQTLGYALNLWRAMTHWIGGMGMLLFVIAFLPKTEGTTYQVFKAETPGPKAGKLVSKLSITARILYLIYFGMTVLCAVMLLCGGVSLYDSVVLSFATAGTGGFTPSSLGIAMYNSLYVEVVLTVFMFLFGINFTLYYFVMLGKVKELFRSEEIRWFFSVIVVATLGVTFSLWIDKFGSFGECLRVSIFQVVSNISTTGYVLQDTSNWPALSQTLLIAVMFCGGCAGSTAGGLKVSRIAILGKSAAREFRTLLNPNRVLDVKLEGRIVDKTVVHGVLRYFVVYLLFMAISVLALTIANPSANGAQSTLMDAITSTISCVNNVGPAAFDYASGNFSTCTVAGKIIMTIDMLAGRLEILPILMLFNPRSWQR